MKYLDVVGATRLSWLPCRRFDIEGHERGVDLIARRRLDRPRTAHSVRIAIREVGTLDDSSK